MGAEGCPARWCNSNNRPNVLATPHHLLDNRPDLEEHVCPQALRDERAHLAEQSQAHPVDRELRRRIETRLRHAVRHPALAATAGVLRKAKCRFVVVSTLPRSRSTNRLSCETKRPSKP